MANKHEFELQELKDEIRELQELKDEIMHRLRARILPTEPNPDTSIIQKRIDELYEGRKRAILEYIQKREKEDEYFRQYRLTHRDHIREYNHQYYLAHKQQKHQYYLAHRDQILKYNHQYYQAHKKELIEKNRQYRHKKIMF
jgi:hypothetical protein